MEFKGQYLTYDEYKLLKGTLEKVPFDLFEYDARKMIDKRTQKRLIGLKNIPDDVKLCVFKMISIKQKYQSLKEQNKAIASESTDGYSVTYRKQEKADIDVENKELMDIIETSLVDVVINNIPVLYLGTDVC